LLGAAAGCAPAPLIKTGPPVVLTVRDDSNPNVLWVVRDIELSQKGTKAKVKRVAAAMDTSSTYYGLFACYRSTAPGYPECYLAKTMGENGSLVWPESPTSFNFPQIADKESK
jgi:hypothetical protein